MSESNKPVKYEQTSTRLMAQVGEVLHYHHYELRMEAAYLR